MCNVISPLGLYNISKFHWYLDISLHIIHIKRLYNVFIFTAIILHFQAHVIIESTVQTAEWSDPNLNCSPLCKLYLNFSEHSEWHRSFKKKKRLRPLSSVVHRWTLNIVKADFLISKQYQTVWHLRDGSDAWDSFSGVLGCPNYDPGLKLQGQFLLVNRVSEKSTILNHRKKTLKKYNGSSTKSYLLCIKLLFDWDLWFSNLNPKLVQKKLSKTLTIWICAAWLLWERSLRQDPTMRCSVQQRDHQS